MQRHSSQTILQETTLKVPSLVQPFLSSTFPSLSHSSPPRLRTATAVFLAARPAPAGIDASIIRPITDIETAGMTAVVSAPGAILHRRCTLQSSITD